MADQHADKNISLKTSSAVESFFWAINSSGVASFPLNKLTMSESATKGFLTNTKYLSPGLEISIRNRYSLLFFSLSIGAFPYYFELEIDIH